MKRAPTSLHAVPRPLPGAAVSSRILSMPSSIDFRRVAAFVDGPLRVIALLVIVLMFVRIFLN